MSSADLTCHVCGTELTMEQLLIHADDRAVVLRLLAMGSPIGAAVGAYTTLFSPPKHRLSMRKQARIFKELLPDIERCAITHRGRDWAVPLAVWESGIDQMLALRSAGKLELPMKGHGYLYAILTSLADKQEAVAEVQLDAARRHPVQGQGAAHAAPVPDFARAALAALKSPGVKP